MHDTIPCRRRHTPSHVDGRFVCATKTLTLVLVEPINDRFVDIAPQIATMKITPLLYLPKIDFQSPPGRNIQAATKMSLRLDRYYDTSNKRVRFIWLLRIAVLHHLAAMQQSTSQPWVACQRWMHCTVASAPAGLSVDAALSFDPKALRRGLVACCGDLSGNKLDLWMVAHYNQANRIKSYIVTIETTI